MKMNELMKKIWVKAEDIGINPRETASALGISYVYYMALSRGERQPEVARRDFYVQAARFLGLPVAQVYLLAGALVPGDFVVQNTLQRKVDRMIEAMRRDPALLGLVPGDSDLQATPESVKILLGLLYDRAMAEGSFAEVVVPPHA